MRLTLGNLQALQKLAARAENNAIDVREDGYDLRVRYFTSGSGRRQRDLVVNRRDNMVTIRDDR